MVNSSCIIIIIIIIIILIVLLIIIVQYKFFWHRLDGLIMYNLYVSESMK